MIKSDVLKWNIHVDIFTVPYHYTQIFIIFTFSTTFIIVILFDMDITRQLEECVFKNKLMQSTTWKSLAVG